MSAPKRKKNVKIKSKFQAFLQNSVFKRKNDSAKFDEQNEIDDDVKTVEQETHTHEEKINKLQENKSLYKEIITYKFEQKKKEHCKRKVNQQAINAKTETLNTFWQILGRKICGNFLPKQNKLEQNLNKFKQEQNEHRKMFKLFEEQKQIYEQCINKFEQEKKTHEENVNIFALQKYSAEQNINNFFQQKNNIYKQNVNRFEQEKKIYDKNVKKFEQQENARPQNVNLLLFKKFLKGEKQIHREIA